MLSLMVKDIKEELEKGKRYHAASKEEKRILDNKLFRENKPIDNSSKDFIDDITESSGEILKSIKKGISSLPRNFNKKTHKETIKKKQISDMSQEELINEIAETKKKSLSSKQLIGGCIGVVAYIILKEIGGWGWHYGDIIGLVLLAFLPGAIFIGGILEDGA